MERVSRHHSLRTATIAIRCRFLLLTEQAMQWFGMGDVSSTTLELGPGWTPMF